LNIESHLYDGIFYSSNMAITNLSPIKRNNLLVRVTCICWIITKAISYKLWLSDRAFPLVPPFSFLNAPSIVHLGLLILSFVLLLSLFIFPSNKKIQVCLIAVELLACLLDQNRWQPWEYELIFILFIFLINRKREANAAVVLVWMFAAVYFYSGLSKLNHAFINDIWHEFILVRLFHFQNSGGWMYRLGYIVGLTEALLGAGLLLKRTRKLSAIILMIIHGTIILLFRIAGNNSSVLPWNLAMMAYLYVLIVADPSFTINYKPLFIGWNKLVLFLFIVMPAFSFFGYWDYYLSSSLYSGIPPRMYMHIKPTSATTSLNQYANPQDSSLIDMNTWSLKEMNSPPYPEWRVYKGIKEQLLKNYPGLEADFFIEGYQDGKKVKVEMK
jgi:hypothetical protein